MSRMLKDKLPAPTSLLLPKLVQGAHKSLLARQQRQKKYHDRGTKVLPPLQIGAPVRIQQGRTWTPAIVLEKHEAPRSFKVKTEDGQVYHRNRKFFSCVNHLSLNHIRWSRQHLRHHQVPLQKQFHLRQQPLNLRSPRSLCLKFP